MVIKYITGKSTKQHTLYVGINKGAEAIHALTRMHYIIVIVKVG